METGKVGWVEGRHPPILIMSPGGGTSGLGDINSGDIINVPRWGGNVLCVDLSLWYVQLFSLCYVQFLVCVLFYARCGRSAPAARALGAHAYVTSLRSVRALRARCGPFGPAAGPPGPLRALRARKASCEPGHTCHLFIVHLF